MLVQRLVSQKKIQPPKWLPDNIQYLAVMGSVAYGVAGESSDWDIYGWAIPPKEVVFPHLAGEIFGFGRQIKRFDQWQQHGIIDRDSGKEYDFTVYNIVKFFQLVMEGNPNMVDSLFVPQRCVIHCTQIGDLVRENRTMFLHKGCWHKFKGYAYSQYRKAKTKNPEGKRLEIIEQYGWDVKFGYHLVRLLEEIEQIMTEHDLDLERSRDLLKLIREGGWTFEQVEDYFNRKEKELSELYQKSTLRYSPDEAAIKRLLLQCLEHHYGSLDKVISANPDVHQLIMKLDEVLNRYR